MPAKPRKAEIDTDVFDAIGHPMRREILSTLRKGERPAMELAAQFDVTPGAVSQHLKILKDAGLVVEERVGRHRIYQLHPRPLKEIMDWTRQFEAFWETKLGALGTFLEKRHGKHRN